MKKILWISAFAPYDAIPHAGGQIENYYMKYLKNEYQNCDLTLIAACTNEELDKVDIQNYGINAKIWTLFMDKKSQIRRMFRFNLLESRFSIFNRYSNVLSNELRWWILKNCKEMLQSGYQPDVIIIQWTQCVVLIEEIQKYFTNTKYICIEEDVMYLNLKRQIDLSKNFIQRQYRKIRFKKLKNRELTSLKHANIVICNNFKDKDLLIKDGVNTKIMVWCPYFKDYSLKEIYNPERSNCEDGLKVIYYGAMDRKENYLSAEWLIRNVAPLLKDIGIKFYIIGAHPINRLLELSDDNLIITGYVKDISKYFGNCLCLAAPLVLGAGIKIKVLEAMSQGVPVLTNNIGIEGIPAINGRDYIYCESPSDYNIAIRKLVSNYDFRKNISQNARKFIHDSFDIKKSADMFVELLKNI